jgi:hypothetical protein
MTTPTRSQITGFVANIKILNFNSKNSFSDGAEEEESSSEESSSEDEVSESEEEDLDAPGTSKDTMKPPRVRQCRTHEKSYLDGFTGKSS